MFEKIFSRASVPTGPVQYLIVGLGNPGSKYEKDVYKRQGYAILNRKANPYNNIRGGLRTGRRKITE